MCTICAPRVMTQLNLPNPGQKGMTVDRAGTDGRIERQLIITMQSKESENLGTYSVHVQSENFKEEDIKIKSLLMQTQSLHGGTHSSGERNQIMQKIQFKARAVKKTCGIPCKMPSYKSNVLVVKREIPRKEYYPTSKRDTYPFSSLP